ELLVRGGVGALAVVDGDVVDHTNKNRQLLALDSTLGQPKAAVMAQRLLDINPQLNLVVRQEFVGPDEDADRLLRELAEALDKGYGSTSTSNTTSSSSSANVTDRSGSSSSSSSDGTQESNVQGLQQDSEGAAAAVPTCSSSNSSSNTGVGPTHGSPRLDWVVDCIDSIAPKLALISAARRAGAQVVSSMGAGGRMDPLAVRVADISETYGDPFAANIRRGLRRSYGIREGVTVVFSVEPTRRDSLALTSPSTRFKRSYYGTISFMPATFGLQISAHILNAVTEGPMLASEALQRQQTRRERGLVTRASSGSNGRSKSSSKGRKGRGSCSSSSNNGVGGEGSSENTCGASSKEEAASMGEVE
ncbi:hypothetical protein Agub_g12689, partial [Astrephomene gubernaculifera]